MWQPQTFQPSSISQSQAWAPQSFQPLQANQPQGQPAANGESPSPQNANVLNNQQEQNPIQSLNQSFQDKPDTYYGSVLPFSRNEKTGDTSFALPEFVRSLGRGVTGMMLDTSGQGKAPGQNLDMDEINTLTMMSPKSVASPSHMALTNNEPAQAPIGNQLAQFGARPTNAGELEDQNLGQLFAKNAKGKIPVSSENTKTIASNFYKQAASSGDTFPPEFTNSLIEKTAAQAPQTLAGKATTGTSPIAELADRWQALRDSPLDMKSIQEMDEGLGDLIDKEILPTGKPTKSGKNLMDVQTNFRNMIMDADVGEGGQSLQKARQAWSQASKMNDVERIIARADPDLSDNPATAIKSGVRTLLSNPKRVRGWTPEEISALKDAGNRGSVGALMHVFGSRLGPLIGGAIGSAGGPIGAVLGAGATYGLSDGARNLATQMQMNRAQNVLNTLGRGVPQ